MSVQFDFVLVHSVCEHDISFFNDCGPFCLVSSLSCVSLKYQWNLVAQSSYDSAFGGVVFSYCRCLRTRARSLNANFSLRPAICFKQFFHHRYLNYVSLSEYRAGVALSLSLNEYDAYVALIVFSQYESLDTRTMSVFTVKHGLRQNFSS